MDSTVEERRKASQRIFFRPTERFFDVLSVVNGGDSLLCQ